MELIKDADIHYSGAKFIALVCVRWLQSHGTGTFLLPARLHWHLIQTKLLLQLCSFCICKVLAPRASNGTERTWSTD